MLRQWPPPLTRMLWSANWPAYCAKRSSTTQPFRQCGEQTRSSPRSASGYCIRYDATKLTNPAHSPTLLTHPSPLCIQRSEPPPSTAEVPETLRRAERSPAEGERPRRLSRSRPADFEQADATAEDRGSPTSSCRDSADANPPTIFSLRCDDKLCPHLLMMYPPLQPL